MNVISFFAGCGGLDLGFEQAGFNVIWANELDSTIFPTYRINHPKTELNTKDICELSAIEIPDCDGFIGGPPCQAWSEAGLQRGFKDKRGKVFLDYVRLIITKQPKFFVIENVPGLLESVHCKSFEYIKNQLSSSNYDLYIDVLNAKDFNIPQDRKRVFIIGFRNDLNIKYSFPKPVTTKYISLRRAIGDIQDAPSSVVSPDTSNFRIKNHEIYIGPFSERYMSRNRVRSWDELSFTIPASASNVPIHPQAPKMIRESHNKWHFVPGKEYLYRRLSVRECARIQSFPDSYSFHYSDVRDGYKMVGNAIPPRLAKVIGLSIIKVFSNMVSKKTLTCKKILVGYFKDDNVKKLIEGNHIYYVRADLRCGSITLKECNDVDAIIIHRNDEVYAYSVIKPPKITDAEYLNRIGFKTSGTKYICFMLGETLNDIKVPLNLKIRNCYKPYILTL